MKGKVQIRILLVASFFLLVLCLFALGGIGSYSLRMSDEALLRNEKVSNLRGHVFKLQNLLNEFTLRQNYRARFQALKLSEEIFAILQTYKAGNEREAGFIAELERRLNRISDIYGNLDNIGPGTLDEEERVRIELLKSFTRVEAAAMIATAGRLQRLIKNEVRTRQDQMSDLVKGIIIFGLFVSGAIVILLYRRVIGPITQVQRAVRQFGEGKYSTRIEETQDDELGELARTFNEMADSLERSRQDIEKESRNTKLALHKAKALRTQADRANQAKTNFLANMSHEIRTPLSVIIGFTQLVNDEDLSPEEQKQYMKLIDKNARHLNALVEDILDISQIESGKLSFASEGFSPREQIESVHSMLLPRAKSKKIDLLLTVSDDVPPVITGDSKRFKQVVINLVGNAVKFTEKGKVEIDMRVNNGALEVTVSDTGIGISDEAQKKLFLLFSQGESDITRRFGGTGLGLHLSQKLAKGMGGKITLVSSEEGKGAVFRFVLPIREQRATQPGSRLSGISSNSRLLEGNRVLVVDDEKDLQNLYSKILKMQGADVDVANNGSEAVEKAESGNYDFVLMDLHMPIMDGFEATRRLRAKNLKTPIIAVTARIFSGDEGKTEGFTRFIKKPASAGKLISTLMEVKKEIAS